MMDRTVQKCPYCLGIPTVNRNSPSVIYYSHQCQLIRFSLLGVPNELNDMVENWNTAINTMRMNLLKDE